VRSFRDVEQLPVFGEKNPKSGLRKRIGRVSDVLLHPAENRVVGFVVSRPDILFLIQRKDRLLALDRVRVLEDRIVVNGSQAWGKAAAKRLGFTWDKSVIWVGMPVVTKSGSKLGYVRDGVFDPEDGSLNGIGLTGGLTADVTLGTKDLPATLLVGFDGESVVVSNDVFAIESEGSAAAAAGRGAAVAQEGARKAAVASTKAAKTAAAYGKSAVRVAAKSQTTKKTLGFLKSMRDQIVDAAGWPDEEDEDKKKRG